MVIKAAANPLLLTTMTLAQLNAFKIYNKSLHRFVNMNKHVLQCISSHFMACLFYLHLPLTGSIHMDWAYMKFAHICQ